MHHLETCWGLVLFNLVSLPDIMQWYSSERRDGSLQFCIGFRHLNVQTKKDSYPLPRIQEVTGEHGRSCALFYHALSRVDFGKSSMAPELQQYIAFMVGNLGFYEFSRMPFGLCNVPATFQHLMQNTLGELNLTYCIIYLDDVIVFGCTEEEYLECLRVVFECTSGNLT